MSLVFSLVGAVAVSALLREQSHKALRDQKGCRVLAAVPHLLLLLLLLLLGHSRHQTDCETRPLLHITTGNMHSCSRCHQILQEAMEGIWKHKQLIINERFTIQYKQ